MYFPSLAGLEQGNHQQCYSGQGKIIYTPYKNEVMNCRALSDITSDWQCINSISYRYIRSFIKHLLSDHVGDTIHTSSQNSIVMLHGRVFPLGRCLNNRIHRESSRRLCKPCQQAGNLLIRLQNYRQM